MYIGPLGGSAKNVGACNFIRPPIDFSSPLNPQSFTLGYANLQTNVYLTGGKIGDFRFYGRELTVNEAMSLFESVGTAKPYANLRARVTTPTRVITPVLSYNCNGNFLPVIGSLPDASKLPAIYSKGNYSTNFWTVPATDFGPFAPYAPISYSGSGSITIPLTNSGIIPQVYTDIKINSGLLGTSGTFLEAIYWRVTTSMPWTNNGVISDLSFTLSTVGHNGKSDLGKQTINNTNYSPISEFNIAYYTQLSHMRGVEILNIGVSFNVYNTIFYPSNGVAGMRLGSDQFGDTNGSIVTDSTNMIILPGFNSVFSSTNATYNLWIKNDQLPSSGTNSKIFDLLLVSADTNGFSSFNTANATVSAVIGSAGELVISDGGTNNIVPSIFTDTNFHMITFSFQSSGVLSIYRDGNLVKTTTDFKNYVFGNKSGTTSILKLGGWKGAIDQLDFYNEALTATDVLNIYQYQFYDVSIFNVYQGPPVSQTINEFTTIPTQTYSNGATVTITPPTASSGLPVSVTVQSGSATISGNTLTLTGGGTVINLAANQGGNIQYAAAPRVNTTFWVNKGTQTIASFTTVANQTFSNGAIVTIRPPTVSSSLPVSVSVKSGPATISGNTVTLTGAGTVVLAANQSGNANYLAATEVTSSFTVAQSAQTINAFTTVASQTFGNGATVTITPPTASSSLPVSVSVKSGPATISGSTVTLTGVGTVVLAANQSGNANYTAASEVTTSFSVAQGNQAINFGALTNRTIGNAPFALNATASSGLPVSYSSASGNISLSSNMVTILGAGTATITASQSGNSNWSAASPVNQNLVINQAPQTINAFTTVANQTFSNGATVTITPPSASSTLPVTVSVKSGPATISGNTVTLTGAGTVVLAANQSGNANYAAASEVTTSFSVGSGSQSITFPSIPGQTFGNGPVTLGATASSSLSVNYSSSSTNISIASNKVTILGAGTATITASQSGNSNWSVAPSITNTMVIAKVSNTIASFTTVANQTFSNGATVTITPPTASSSLPVSVSVKSGPATISGNTVTLTGAGTVVLAANQSGNANYLATTEVTTSFTVAQSSQTINAFTTVASQTFGNGATVTITPPTASSSLPVSVSVKSGPATISGNTVTLSGVGTVVLAANQSGNANYTAASEVTTSFSVAQGNQAINFGALTNRTFGNAPFALNATASSGLPVSYSSASGNISLSSNMVTILGAGTATITASQNGNSNWSEAPSITNMMVIAKTSNTIASFTTVANQTFRNGAIVTITPPSASSTLPVTISVKSGPATISGNTVTLTGVGMVVLAANQAGNANYLAATEVTTSFSVSAGSQTITFPSIPSQPISTNQITLNASASSGLPVDYSIISGAASLVSSNTLALNGIGTITVQASQVGNTNWSVATPVKQIFVVSRGSQSITFTPLASNTFGQAPYRLTNATASSGLPVSYASSVPAVATIVSNNTLTIVGAGTTTITASQPGNTNWAAATNVARTLVVLKASNTISGFAPVADRTYVPNAVITLPAPLPAASSRLPVTISVKSGPALMSGTNAVRMTGGGTVVLAANQPGNANYLAAPEVTNSFQILQATQSIAPFTQVTPKTNGTAPFTVTLPAASSALPVRLSVLSGPATVSNSTVTLRGAGLVTLAANQNGNSNYLAAPQVTTSFIVARGNQAITFAALSNRTYGGAPFAILGMSSSGLPLTYTSSDTNVAIVTTNSVADVVTDLGDIPMELLTQSAPVTVANFISFADKGAYDNSFFHRSVPGFVIQGGGYVASTNLAPISAKAPITNEYSLSNTRGTVAMALVGTNPNSATTQWFINLTNNSSILDNTNIAGNPPFAVFARVLGKGLSVVDSIVSLPIYNADAPFNELPAQGVTNGQLNLKVSNLVSMDIGIVRGPAVVIVGAGTATIVASQNGNSNYLAATPVTNTLVVGRVRALVALSNLRHTYDGVAKSVIVTTTPRSLPVTVSYRNSSAAPVNAGNYPVMATVNDSNYSGVATGILAVARATQNITFAPPSSVNFSTNGVINLEATSSSGLPVTYTSSIPAVLSISGSKAYMKKRGSSIITATQAGNSNIAPAVSVRKIIRIW